MATNPNVKFYRGPKSSYNASTHSNGIYFATDTLEILMNSQSYGGGISSVSYANDTITLTLTNGTKKTVKLTTATLTANGLMSKEDKVRIDGIFGGNLSLPTPVITGTWTFQNSSGTTVASSAISPAPDANNPVLETGYKAQFSGTFKWTSESGKKDPTQVASNSSWTTLPASGVASANYSTGYVTANTTVRAAIQAAKTGLMATETAVKGTVISVVPATGWDTATATKTVTFKHRAYFGFSTTKSITEAILKGFSDKNSLVTSRATTKNGVTATASQYYVYAYPQALGALTKVILDGATPVLDAFTRSTLLITNDAGTKVDLYVYVSNNPGAFTNVSLKFE